MIIKNGLVFGEDCKFAPGEVRISGEYFAENAEASDTQEVVDFFVLEQTKVNGTVYILVTDSEEEEAASGCGQEITIGK